MSSPLPLKDLQHQFLDYLKQQQPEQSHPLQDQVVDQGNINARQRLEIYANAYRVRLQKVIETDHPVLCTYLGDELFAELLQGYLQKHPSQVRSLRHFCTALPAYLGATEPFASHPILAELAAFENLLLDCFDAPDRERLAFSAAQALPTEQWPAMCLRLHPGVQFFPARWNSVESWQAIKAERDPPPAAGVVSDTGQSGIQPWLVWRDRERLTQFRSLRAPELAALNGVLEGHDFAALCEAVVDYFPAEQVGRQMADYLQRWFADGLITGIR